MYTHAHLILTVIFSFVSCFYLNEVNAFAIRQPRFIDHFRPSIHLNERAPAPGLLGSLGDTVSDLTSPTGTGTGNAPPNPDHPPPASIGSGSDGVDISAPLVGDISLGLNPSDGLNANVDSPLATVHAQVNPSEGVNAGVDSPVVSVQAHAQIDPSAGIQVGADVQAAGIATASVGMGIGSGGLSVAAAGIATIKANPSDGISAALPPLGVTAQAGTGGITVAAAGIATIKANPSDGISAALPPLGVTAQAGTGGITVGVPVATVGISKGGISATLPGGAGVGVSTLPISGGGVGISVGLPGGGTITATIQSPTESLPLPSVSPTGKSDEPTHESHTHVTDTDTVPPVVTSVPVAASSSSVSNSDITTAAVSASQSQSLSILSSASESVSPSGSENIPPSDTISLDPSLRHSGVPSGAHLGIGNTDTALPTSTNNPNLNPGSSASHQNNLAIILGSLLGVLGLICVVCGLLWVRRRGIKRRREEVRRFEREKVLNRIGGWKLTSEPDLDEMAFAAPTRAASYKTFSSMGSGGGGGGGGGLTIVTGTRTASTGRPEGWTYEPYIPPSPSPSPLGTPTSAQFKFSAFEPLTLSLTGHGTPRALTPSQVTPPATPTLQIPFLLPLPLPPPISPIMSSSGPLFVVDEQDEESSRSDHNPPKLNLNPFETAEERAERAYGDFPGQPSTPSTTCHDPFADPGSARHSRQLSYASTVTGESGFSSETDYGTVIPGGRFTAALARPLSRNASTSTTPSTLPAASAGGLWLTRPLSQASTRSGHTTYTTASEGDGTFGHGRESGSVSTSRAESMIYSEESSHTFIDTTVINAEVQSAHRAQLNASFARPRVISTYSTGSNPTSSTSSKDGSSATVTIQTAYRPGDAHSMRTSVASVVSETGTLRSERVERYESFGNVLGVRNA